MYISTFAVGYLPKPSDPPANQAEFIAATMQPIVSFVVLCSVAIHGLSIPFFSLGRRVHSVSSRTWSRHASGPDWATHTRHITRAEDVVINRDRDVSAMENGRAGLAEEEKTIMESRRTSTDVKATREDGSSKTEDAWKGDDTTKEKPPPDGTETTTEWKEGSDKIVERQEAPGEDVGLTEPRMVCVLTFHPRLSSRLSVTHMRRRVPLFLWVALCGQPFLTFIISVTLQRALRGVLNPSNTMSPSLELKCKRSSPPLGY